MKLHPSKTIYLLIGPKGSGKSFIGTLMDRHFGITFLRVEDWAKAVKKDRSINNEDYLRDVFAAIEGGIRKSLENLDEIVFESTGLTPFFEKMYQNLKSDFNLITIGIEVPAQLCLQRVKSRDQSIHINVSDDQVLQINEAVRKMNRKTDFRIENVGKTEEELVNEINKIIK